jgi:hypothetical protein
MVDAIHHNPARRRLAHVTEYEIVTFREHGYGACPRGYKANLDGTRRRARVLLQDDGARCRYDRRSSRLFNKLSAGTISGVLTSNYRFRKVLLHSAPPDTFADLFSNSIVMANICLARCNFLAGIASLKSATYQRP